MAAYGPFLIAVAGVAPSSGSQAAAGSQLTAAFWVRYFDAIWPVAKLSEACARLIGLLFGLQGFLSWWMVASGLLDAPQVSHFRLTIHLLTALLLLALWLAFNRIYDQSGLRWRQWSALGALTLVVIVVQIAYGGLVAGLKAGHISNTWPLMFGVWAPGGMWTVLDSWLMSAVAAPVTVHFIHRWLAEALWLWWRQRHGKLGASAFWLAIIVLVQISLGASVVIFGVPLWLALVHQATAVVTFAAVVHLNHRLATAR